MKIGIVGHEAKKFTPETEAEAKRIIRTLLKEGNTLVSGGCHLGGIDIWAEEIADEMGLEKEIYLPAIKKWEGGYKQRNLQIAHVSDIVYCIVVKEYPENYNGMKFNYCYHCDTDAHIKSGGCWTAKKAQQFGNKAEWIEI
jgi:hypothetical protein